MISFYSYHNRAWEGLSDDLGKKRFALSIIENGLAPATSDYHRIESIAAPLLPIILVINEYLFNGSWMPIFILNSIIGTISCIIIYKISIRFFNPQTTLMVLAWVALYPNYIRYIGTAGNEPWLVFLFSSCFYFLVRTIYSEKVNFFPVILSVFFTLIIHLDERYIIYSFLFSGFLLLGSSGFVIRIKRVLIFIICSIIFSLPWLYRNYLYYNDIVLLTCRTNNITNPIFHHRAELMFFEHERDTRYLTRQQIDSVQKGLLFRFSSGKPIPPLQIESMKNGNIPHSFTGVEKIISRVKLLWMPIKARDSYRITGFEFSPKWSIKHNFLTGLSFGILLPFMIIAFFELFKRKQYILALLFSGVLIFHTLIHVAFIPYARDRYRHPVDFIVIILGVFGISIIYNLWFNLKSKTSSTK